MWILPEHLWWSTCSYESLRKHRSFISFPAAKPLPSGLRSASKPVVTLQSFTEGGFQGNHPDKSHSASNRFVNKCLYLTYIHSMPYPQDASPVLFRCVVHSLHMSGSGWEWNLNHSWIRGAWFCKTWLQILSISLLANGSFHYFKNW